MCVSDECKHEWFSVYHRVRINICTRVLFRDFLCVLDIPMSNNGLYAIMVFGYLFYIYWCLCILLCTKGVLIAIRTFMGKYVRHNI